MSKHKISNENKNVFKKYIYNLNIQILNENVSVFTFSNTFLNNVQKIAQQNQQNATATATDGGKRRNNNNTNSFLIICQIIC